MSKTATHGGARQGAGRKATNVATKTLTFRIPVADLAVLAESGITNFSRFYVEAGRMAIKKIKKSLK